MAEKKNGARREVRPYYISFKRDGNSMIIFTSDNAPEVFRESIDFVTLKCHGEPVFIARSEDILAIYDMKSMDLNRADYQRFIKTHIGGKLELLT